MEKSFPNGWKVEKLSSDTFRETLPQTKHQLVEASTYTYLPIRLSSNQVVALFGGRRNRPELMAPRLFVRKCAFLPPEFVVGIIWLFSFSEEDYLFIHRARVDNPLFKLDLPPRKRQPQATTRADFDQLWTFTELTCAEVNSPISSRSKFMLIQL